MISVFGVVNFSYAQSKAASDSKVESSDIELPNATANETKQEAANGVSIIDLVSHSGPVVQGVLILLVVMSLATWGIVINKWTQLKKAKDESSEFSDLFWNSRNLAQINEKSKSLHESPVASVFCAGHSELTQILKSSEKDEEGGGSDFGDIYNIDRALKRAKSQELNRLENGTTFLATTASAAPFIGLFGTVWGIMNAFIGLSQVKSSSIQAVAPGISEALIATAIGLAAAIPAAIFYNYFSREIRVFSRAMDMFSAEFLNIARRHFLRS